MTTTTLTLRDGRSISGSIFSYDTRTIVISTVMTELPHSTKHSFEIIRVNSVVDCSSSSSALTEANLSPPLLGKTTSLNLSKLALRERNAINAIRSEIEKYNTNASVDGQRVFDLLSKTMPCVWDGNDIVVMDEVRVKESGGYRECVGDDKIRVRVNKVLGL